MNAFYDSESRVREKNSVLLSFFEKKAPETAIYGEKYLKNTAVHGMIKSVKT